MIAVIKWPLQLAAYVIFWVVVIGLSVAPPYTYSDPDLAQLKVNVIHAAKPVGGCRQLSREELQELAPNMRQPRSCPRERNLLHLEIELDGEVILNQTVSPSGLWADGPATVYEKFAVEPGTHELAVRMADTGDLDQFDYAQRKTIELAPAQNFVVNFISSEGKFLLE